MAFAGCSSKPEHPAAAPIQYNLASSPQPKPSDAWPLPPEAAESLFKSGEIHLRSRQGAGGGVTGASKVTLYSPEHDLAIAAKWKTVPFWLESWNNSPRREIAAYEIQKLFLDPQDYVVPPTAVRCLPLDEYREVFGDVGPTFDDTQCVLGVLALWLDNVTIESQLLDQERFAADGTYAYHLANFNVLTFIIDHKDGRINNFLVSKNEADRRVFAIDNGISFDAWIWNWFVPNWNDLRIPAIREDTVDRLRRVKPEQIKQLGVVAELHLDDDGVYRLVEAGPNLDPDDGARTANGVVQFGLNADEVDDVREQIEEIIELVDTGELPVF
jgi:hypothetical protein